MNNLKTSLLSFWSKTKEFIKNWSELLTIPVAFALWYVSPYILRLVDETAGQSDAGIFQYLVSATVAILFGHALIWLILKIAWPDMYELLDDCITEEKWLTTWQKVQFSLYYWGFLLLSWAILVAGMS
jgi:hypothetical protein